MTDPLDSGLAVRVLDTAGHTAGVGVLVGPREILTCAHVVNAALGRDRAAQDQPAGEVTVELAAGAGPPLRAEVQRWLPPPRTGAIGDDIAGLVLTSELPADATPARLAVNPPARGRVMDVFGYPGNPPRPHGAWMTATVRGQIEGRHLQLDSTLDSALRTQPGFNGSPVYDRGTGRVVGLLTTAPPAASGQRDSYAITADRLRLAWPEVLDSGLARVRRRAADGVSELTIVGPEQLGSQPVPDDDVESRFTRLEHEVTRLREDVASAVRSLRWPTVTWPSSAPRCGPITRS